MAFKREGYRWSDLSLRDLGEILSYPGFYRLVNRYLSFGAKEMLHSVFISLTGK